MRPESAQKRLKEARGLRVVVVGGHGPFRGLEAPQSAGFQYTVTIIAFNQCVREDLNALTEAIIGAAFDVHRELGPGLLENAYEACFGFELISRGLSIERQRALPVVYKGQRLDCGYRLDFVVEDTVIVEVKAVERLERVHSAQLLSYLSLRDVPLVCCSTSTQVS